MTVWRFICSVRHGALAEPTCRSSGWVRSSAARVLQGRANVAPMGRTDVLVHRTDSARDVRALVSRPLR
eukprot:2115802-Prymnesium_polylepis.2